MSDEHEERRDAKAQMTDFLSEIDAALSMDAPIPRDRVISWIGAASNIETLAKLYHLTGESYYRIQPDLGKEHTCGLIQTYLLECIRQNVTSREAVEGRWEAAQSLHAWFCHLNEQQNTSHVLTAAASAVTELFLASGGDVRAAIEQGFLEHVLETAALRPYFEHWSTDTRLRDAWQRALEWVRRILTLPGESLRNFSEFKRSKDSSPRFLTPVWALGVRDDASCNLR